MKQLVFAALATVLYGCATTPPVDLVSSFDPSEIAWFKVPGKNTIAGNAVLRTVGGEARTCAALSAHLVPISSYATERFTRMYGNTSSGFLSATSGFKFTQTDAAYEANSRTVRCDAQGNFRFENVPDGDYFVTAFVTWGVPTSAYVTATQGGVLMQRVSVSNGETKQIVLTRH